MNKAFIFPGQGSQIVGMGKDFFDSFSVAKSVFETTDEVLEYRLSDIIFAGPAESLTLTANTQPALMTVSMAILEVIKQESGKKINELCSYVAGHSLGEYSALCASGAISLADSAKLLHIRGSSMQAASPEGEGAMAACIGISHQQLQEMLNELITEGVCEIANDNVAGQVVISGHDYNIDRMIAVLKDSGFKAIKLKVSAPFHSSLIKPAEIAMQQALDEIKINEPIVPLIANVTAKVENAEDIKPNLIKQICSTVRWRETMDELARLGVTDLVEIGSGRVLGGLAGKTNHNFKISNISNIEEMRDYLSKI